jgi:hypothetical protein
MNNNNFQYIEELLYTYKKKDKVLKQFDLDIAEIRLRYLDGDVKAIDYSKDIVQTSNISSPTELAIIKAEKEIEKLIKAKTLKEIHYNKLELALEDTTDIEQKIIEYKYFRSHYTWNTVSRTIGLNRTSCIDYRNKLINRIIENYNIRIEQ